MNRRMMLATLLSGMLVFTTACASAPATPEPAAPVEAPVSAYADGNYFAQGDFDANSGWKSTVTMEVKDGKIVSVDWNGASVNAGKNKKATSMDGGYPMVEKGGASAPWHEQAALVEKYLVDTQKPEAINFSDADGHTDSITGATIKVKDFAELAQKALSAGPVEKGPYKDGAYHAESKAFAENSGWKETVDLTVINGHIVAVNWNGVHKDGGDDKKTQSKDGRYGLKEKGGAIAEWHEQAAAMERFVLEKQDPAAITIKDDAGHTDAVSGATIKVKEFAQLVDEALSTAK